jgi:hypothetical protein
MSVGESKSGQGRGRFLPREKGQERFLIRVSWDFVG